MLGDRVKVALVAVGVTEEHVSRLLGRPCNCEERLLRLNALDLWARRVASGRLDKAKEYLVSVLGG